MTSCYGMALHIPPVRRYLWTDAFIVCNLLGADDAELVNRARGLVDKVHSVLGSYATNDGLGRLGTLSPDPSRPTLGGLRIGKDLPEVLNTAETGDACDWDRDGQVGPGGKGTCKDLQLFMCCE